MSVDPIRKNLLAITGRFGRGWVFMDTSISPSPLGLYGHYLGLYGHPLGSLWTGLGSLWTLVLSGINLVLTLVLATEYWGRFALENWNTETTSVTRITTR